MITILAIIFLLGILVFIHELGHFIAARMCNIHVEKFSFGFGPKLISRKIGETEYRISLIPLGGYVKMLGENPEEQNLNENEKERSFSHKKWWQKGFIAFNGPFFNFLFAVFILSLTFIIGIKTYDLEPIIGEIKTDANSLQKLKKGDVIKEVDGKKISGWFEIIQTWKDSDKSVHDLKILRNGEEKQIQISDFPYQTWVNDVQAFAPAKIGEVYYGLPAYQAGLEEGDIVLRIEDKKINSWYDMRQVILANPDKELKFLVKRGDKTLEFVVTPQSNPEKDEDQGIVGITQQLKLVDVENYGLFNSVKIGTITAISTIKNYYEGLYKLLRKPSNAKESMGGPIMIAALTKQQTEKGISSYLSFMAMVSIILMIMNLLPIPVLDGGQILFALIEGIKGSPLSISIQEVLQRVGVVILLMLMVFAFYNDISRYLKRHLSLKNEVDSTQTIE